MTTKTYDQVDDLPIFENEGDDGLPVFNQDVKKKVGGKVGSIAYPELESEAPSITKTPNQIVGLANEFNRISGRISEIEKPIYGTGYVGTPKASSRDKGKLTEIEGQIKDAGYDPKEIISEFGDFPVPAHELDIDGLLKEKKENPLAFERTKAAYKWQVPLFNSIRQQDPENADGIIQLILSGQSGGDYESKRGQTKVAVEAANKYIQDEDERRKIVQNISTDKALSYGIDDESKLNSVSQDQRYLGGGGLNKYQIQGLQFLEDTDPEKAKLYSDRVGKRPESLWGDEDVQRGYETKARDLESFGMQLELKALQERLTDFKNKSGKDELTPEEGQQYITLYDQYETVLKDIEGQQERFPKVAAMEADKMYQEAMGQRNGAGKRMILGVGENVGDALNTVNDFLMSPFRSKEERIIDDLEDLGSKEFTASVQRYKTAANTLIGEDGKLNLTTGAVFNTMSDVGAEIVSSIGIGAVTGMPATKVGRMGSMFASTFATAYNDYYNEAIKKDIKNPTTYALIHTFKESVTELINNDLAVVNKLVKPKSTLSLLAKNISKQEWDDIAKVGGNRFSKALEAGQRVGKAAVKNAFQEDVEEVAAQLGGNLINMEVYNEDVDLIDGVGATIVNTTLGTLPFGGLGVVGEVRATNRNQKYALYEAAQNKEKYLIQLDKDVQNGVVAESKAEKIRTIIEKSAAALDELLSKNKITQDVSDNEKVDILAKEVQAEDAKTILAEAVEKGKVKGIYAEQAEKNPDKVLKDIAQQAQNLDNNFESHNDGKEEESRQAAEETFGNKVVEAAINLYPKPSTPTEAVIQEGAAENVVPSTLGIQNETTNEGQETPPVPDTPEATGAATGAPNQTGGTTEEGGGGIPPEAVKAEIFSEQPATELSFRGLQNVANEFGYDDVRSRDVVSDIQERQNARATVDEWREAATYAQNVEGLLTKIANREMVPTAKQRLILQQHLANKAAELRTATGEDYNAKLAEVRRLKEIGQIARQEAGAALRIPEGGQSHPVADYGDAAVAMAEAIGVDELNEQQKKEVDDLVSNYEQKDKDAQAKIVELEAKLSEMEAAKEVKKTYAEKPAKKKTAQEYKDERAGFREELKAAKEEHEKWLKDQGIKQAGIGLSLTPKMIKAIGKIAKSHIQEVGDNIAEVTKRVLDEVKDFFPGITEIEVQDIISGSYDKEAAKLEAIINRNEKVTTELRDKIANQDFSPKEKPKSIFDNAELKKKYPELYKQVLDSITAREDAKHDFDVALAKAELAKRPPRQKIFDIAKGVVATSKAIASGIDFSAIMMQNLVAMVSHPRSAAKALPMSFVDMASDKSFTRWLAEIHNSKNWELIEKSGLNITDPKALREEGKEEIFSGNLLDKKVKIKGKKYQLSKFLTKPFERQFTSLGNRMRVNMFLRSAERWAEKKMTFETHPEKYKSLARMLNTETGRGGVPDNVKKSMENITPIIWSPRLIASRLNLLGISDLAYLTGKKGYYAGLDPQVRNMAIMDMVKFVGFGIAVMGVAAYFGAETDDDPESPTFGTIKFGEKKYNAWGGFTPYIKTIYQSVSGKQHSNTKDKAVNAGVLGMKFLRGRLTPFAGTVTNLAFGKDYSGKPFGLENVVETTLQPISIKGIREGIEKDGTKGIITQGIPSIIGIGVSDERDYTKKTTLIIYEKNKKRLATPEEQEKYDSLKEKKEGQKLALFIKNGVWIDKYGDVTVDKDSKKKTVKYETLDAEQIKDLNESISRQSAYQAKKELKWNKK